MILIYGDAADMLQDLKDINSRTPGPSGSSNGE